MRADSLVKAEVWTGVGVDTMDVDKKKGTRDALKGLGLSNRKDVVPQRESSGIKMENLKRGRCGGEDQVSGFESGVLYHMSL